MWSLLIPWISPKTFVVRSQQLLPFLWVICISSLTYGLMGALYLSPPDEVQGEGYRILFIHAPLAFLSLLVYAVISIAAFSALVFRLKLSFLVIRHSILIGAVFTFLALLTGSLWGKPMWGTFWIWDARLTSELILFFLYLSLLILQSALLQKKRSEKVLAILILIGSIDLPIIHYSVNWWNTLHQGPTLKLWGHSSIDRSMLYPLLAMITAFVCYYAILLFLRINNELLSFQFNLMRKNHARKNN